MREAMASVQLSSLSSKLRLAEGAKNIGRHVFHLAGASNATSR
jgi:hypothetical protein